jgi:hypothetical protein
MNTSFTPMHLNLLIESYTGSTSSYPDTPTKTKYQDDLLKQGLIYPIGHITFQTTAYGKRKIEELLIVMELPGGKKA